MIKQTVTDEQEGRQAESEAETSIKTINVLISVILAKYDRVALEASNNTTYLRQPLLTADANESIGGGGLCPG